MRSRIDTWLRVAVFAAVASSATLPTVAQTAGPTDAEITRALAILKADPNLSAERTIKSLRWLDTSSTGTNPSRLFAWLEWIAGFFGWLTQSARILMWIGIAAAAAALLVYIVRMTRSGGVAIGGHSLVVPTHVHDLDIRPESLPPDIGGAARALWDSGERRAALALLYRGLLSRLAHVHHVPIRDSSTEGDCLALSAGHLPAERHEYASRLVRVWQRFVYGGQDIQPATVYLLCDDFAPALDGSSRGGAA
ncbi:MAG TPA: DUF4129 domain-containing protein [Vicinamibacterales bacterium]